MIEAGWQRVVFDFDGTLAHRPGMWSQTLLDVLDTHLPGHGVSLDDLRPFLLDGFPWHRPDVAHPELCDPSAWWEHVTRLFAPAFQFAGAPDDLLPDLLAAARHHYCDPTRFLLYDDTLGALDRLVDADIAVVILSNHVPELADIVDHLGLTSRVQEVISSAVIGFEKPHPEAFQAALAGAEPHRCWMVGDNPIADVQGARAVGMRAALVRHHDATGRSVADAVDEILGAPPRSNDERRGSADTSSG